MPGSLSGRSAVITGGGRGIGAACARTLAAEGAAVAVAARTASEVETVAEALRKEGLQAYALSCDVADPESVKAMAAAAQARLGAVDILVNNAGIAISNPLLRITLEEWNRALAVNATGALLCTQACLPGMLARGWGRIVNIASVAGRTGGAYIAAYAASKHAVVGLTRAAAVELADKGITVNAICPGYVDTALAGQAVSRIEARTGLGRPQALDALRGVSPQKRLMSPEEVAALAAFLCREEARGINGQAIVLDGGWLTA